MVKGLQGSTIPYDAYRAYCFRVPYHDVVLQVHGQGMWLEFGWVGNRLQGPTTETCPTPQTLSPEPETLNSKPSPQTFGRVSVAMVGS